MSVAKRLLDLGGAALGLLLLAPAFAVLALLVRAEDGGPVFFRQERVGRAGRPFRIWKFRTMVPGAERLGGAVTADRDPRVTRVGRWLRRRRLDELPQLVNVLVGDMSLVGPRPEVPRYVARYTPAERRVLEVRPGITDPASLAYREEGAILADASDRELTYLTEIMPRKVELQLAYAARATVWSDLGVIAASLHALTTDPAEGRVPPGPARSPA
jgi:lipopolysaccharide/colanic/teichoic acid biosynthesis glycosyltransferase